MKHPSSGQRLCFMRPAGLILSLLLTTGACTSNRVNAVLDGSYTLAPMNFTEYAEKKANEKISILLSGKAANRSLPLRGTIVWDDYRFKQKHVAKYGPASRYHLYFYAGRKGTEFPSSSITFPLLLTNSSSQCRYIISLHDSYYMSGYEQKLWLDDGDFNTLYSLFIYLPLRSIDNRDVFEVTRKPFSSGALYYLVTRIHFKKDFIVYNEKKDRKLLRIRKGSVIYFQDKKLFEVR
ncbi:MAG TPA: hypothetical protein PKM65_00005 [Spirochaetota bacterium]|nr:hypothetical protein [Spirochaetota bacterium]HNT12888.1 hypothetical protein [Spirochaetota bacterium]